MAPINEPQAQNDKKKKKKSHPEQNPGFVPDECLVWRLLCIPSLTLGAHPKCCSPSNPAEPSHVPQPQSNTGFNLEGKQGHNPTHLRPEPYIRYIILLVFFT